MIDFAYIASHPDLFRSSSRPISPDIASRGMRLYEMTAPIEVAGIKLMAPFVYGFDAKSFYHLTVILGANHIALANWGFDLVSNQFTVEAIEPRDISGAMSLGKP